MMEHVLWLDVKILEVVVGKVGLWTKSKTVSQITECIAIKKEIQIIHVECILANG